MSGEATIEVTDLHKKYGQTVALDGLSFTVRPGRSPGSSAPTAPASRPRCA